MGKSRPRKNTGSNKDQQACARMNTKTFKRKPGQRSGVWAGTRWILKPRGVTYFCIGRNNTCDHTAFRGRGTMCDSCAARIAICPYRLEWSEPIGDGTDRVRCMLQDNRSGQLCGTEFRDLRAFKPHVRASWHNRPRQRWTNVPDGHDDHDHIENPPVEQAAPSTNTTAAQEYEFEDEPEQQAEEQPMEQDVAEPQSNEQVALVARLEAELEQLRTDHEAELTHRDEYQRKMDESNRAREDAEKRCHEQEDQMHAAVATRQLIDDVDRNELIDQLRVAQDNGVKSSDECRQLKEENGRLEAEARRKSQTDEANEIKIRALTNDVKTLHGQLEKTELEKRTLQSEMTDASSSKNEMAKNIRELEKSKSSLAEQVDKQRSQLEQLQDALREAERDKERSDIDYKALETEAMERAAQQKEVDRQRFDAELEILTEQLRVANDDRAKISDECRRLEEEALCKSQMDEEKETEIRSLTNEVQALQGQLQDAKRDQRTLQSELVNASTRKNEMEKNIRELEKSKGDLAQKFDKQRVQLEQWKDDLGKVKLINERSDIDYNALKAEGEEMRRGFLEKIRKLEEEIEREAGFKRILAELEASAQARAKDQTDALNAENAALKRQLASERSANAAAAHLEEQHSKQA